MPKELLKNPKWIHRKCKQEELGQSESLKCGLKVAQEMKITAVMIILVNQPLISIQLLYLFKQGRPSYIAFSYQGMLRPPVLFHSSSFSKLFQLQGDEGARRIIRGDSTGVTIECHDENDFLDCDTPIQYKKLSQIYRNL
jgi:molybdenum cofactor cytidylyltransferase